MRDAEPRAESLLVCSVRRWTACTVVESRYYAPGIPMVLRTGAFAVLEQTFDEVVSARVEATEALARPTDELPMFASWYAPRVRVPAALEAQIRALCFTADGEAP